MAPALALPVVDTDQGEDAGASRRTPRPSRSSGGTGDTLIGPSSQILPASRAPCAGHAGSMGPAARSTASALRLRGLPGGGWNVTAPS